VNFLALPAFVIDPTAAVAAIPSPTGSMNNDGSQAISNEFLEMLLASEAAFQGTVPVEPQPPLASEIMIEVLEEAPVVPTTPPLILSSVEAAPPSADEAQDQVATAYATVATMEVAPPLDAEAASTESPTPVPATPVLATPVLATLVARTGWESSEEEPEEIEELSVVSTSSERLDIVGVPASILIPAPIELPHSSKPNVTDTGDVSEIKFGRSTPTSIAVFSESPDVPAKPSNDAPVILEALVTPKSVAAHVASSNVAPSNEPLPKQIDQPAREVALSEPPSAPAPELRSMSFETASQNDPESSDKDEHSRAPTQENVPAIDKATPFANVATTTSSAAKSERPATLEAPRPPLLVVDEKHFQSERIPLKQMDVRIPDSNGDITVRLQERAGSLHVSVRSSDSQIANGVANALPELTRALDTEGFRAEAWTPQINSFGDVRPDDAMGAVVAFSRSEGPGLLQAEQPQTDDGHGEHQSEPDWKEQQDKRRKRQTEEEFKENLW